MQRKGVLIFMAVLLFVFVLVCVFINWFVKDFNKGLSTAPKDETAMIQSPGCFLPDSKKEVDTLLDKLKYTKNWKVISASDSSKSTALDGLLAYREFDVNAKVIRKNTDGYVELDYTASKVWGYKVALVEISKSAKQVSVPSEFGYKLTSAKCDEKEINLSVHSTFKFGTQSCLLFQNKRVGLVVFEMGNDSKREFTIEALNTVRDEVLSAMK